MSEISVLFAVEAEQLLLTEMYDEAIELCNSGLNVYPEYASAYGIIARALQQLGRSSEATEVINNAVKQFPTNRLLKTIAEDIKKQAVIIAANEAIDFAKSTTNSNSEFDLDSMIQSSIDNNPYLTKSELLSMPEDVQYNSSVIDEYNIDSEEDIIHELKTDDDEFDWSAFSAITNSDSTIINEPISNNDIDELVANENEVIDEPISNNDIDELVANENEVIDEPLASDNQTMDINAFEDANDQEFDINALINETFSGIISTKDDIELNSDSPELDYDLDLKSNTEDLKSSEFDILQDNDTNEFTDGSSEFQSTTSDVSDSDIFEFNDDSEDADDNSANEALLSELYDSIDSEEATPAIEGHINNDDFLINLTTKLNAVNSELPILSPEETALASAQVYDFSQSTYEDELGEIDDNIITTSDDSVVTSAELVEEEIPTHLTEYIGLKGFAEKMMYSDSVFDRKIRARHLSLIPGLDNSPIRELRYIQKKTYSYQSLPQEPEYCVQALMPKDGQSDFASLFGFKSFQEQSAHIIADTIELNSSKKTATDVKKDIITETIANIYVLQGAYQEAIKAYSDLAEQYPDKREYFEKKISDTIAKEENNIIKE